MDDQTNGTTAYDYLQAQRVLQQRQALAQALMNSQSPASYSVVPGQTSKGSGGGWVVPNKWGAASSALQKVLGGAMMAKNNQDQQQDVQNQRQALMSALQNVQSPVTQIQNVPQSEQPADGQDDDSTLSEVNPTAQREQLVSRPKTQSEQMGGILDLLQSGPMGQAMAQQMMTPHQYDYLKDDNTGKIVGVDKVNPNNHVVVDQGTGGMNPKVAADAQTLIRNTDPNNADAVAATNAQLIRMGYTQQPLSAKQIAGMQATSTERADVPLKNAQTNEANTNSAFTAGPKTAQTNAETGLAQTNTSKATADTVSSIATKKGEAQSELAGINKLDQQLATAEGLVGKASGRWTSVGGYLASYAGGGADKQKLDQILNDTRLAGIIQDEENKGRVGSGLFNAYKDHSLTSSMQPEALMQGLKAMRQNLQSQAAAKQGEINAHKFALDAMGYQEPPASTTGQTGGFTLPNQ